MSFSGLSPVQMAAAANLCRDTEPRLALAAAPPASKVSHRGRPPLCETFGAGRVAAKASRWLMSQRIRLQAGARQRASTDYAPQPPPPSESAWAHRGVDGGRPGDRRPPLFCVCVSTWSRTSATESFDEQVHTTSSEGAHVSPPALGTSSGTDWTSPSPLARSDARLLAEGALRLGRASARCRPLRLAPWAWPCALVMLMV